MIRNLYLFWATVLLASCAQVTPFHTARTEGDNNLTISPTLDATGYVGEIIGADGNAIFPGIRAEVAYGLNDKLDIVASVHSAGSFKGSVKFQIYGDNLSSFAFAAMPGYEYQTNLYSTGTNFVSIQRLHFPLIFSVRGSDILDYYVGPNLVLQFSDDPQNTAFPGIFGGIEMGKRVKYNVGIGAFIPYTFNIGTSGYLTQFGISARIPLFRRD